MDFKTLQEEQRGALARNLPLGTYTVELQALNVAEEAGELCRAVLKRAQGIRGTREEWEGEIRKEIGDVILSAGHVAHIMNWDLGELVQERWNEVKTRNFNVDQIGHGIPKDE